MVCKLVTYFVSAVSHNGEKGVTHSFLLDGEAVTTENELLRRFCELRQTSDGQVLVVEVRIIAKDIISL